MKLRNKGLAVALTATLGLGVAGETAADVHGLGYLEVKYLIIAFSPLPTGSAPGLFTFSTNQDAILNGIADASAGNAQCAGNFPDLGTCGGGPPVVSGTVQNAPCGGVARGANDYQKFSTGTEYSNAEAAIDSSQLASGAPTHIRQIAESNLKVGSSAQANTNVASNTFLDITGSFVGGQLYISFEAIIDVMAEVTGGDLGIAQAGSSLSVVLTNSDTGATLLAWAPNGNNTITTCGAGLACVAWETGPSLNNTVASAGAVNQVAGMGYYEVEVHYLADGTYNIAVSATTLTDLARIRQVPVQRWPWNWWPPNFEELMMWISCPTWVPLRHPTPIPLIP